MSEQLRQSVSEEAKNTLFEEARSIVNTKTAALALSVSSIIACSPDKEMTEVPNEAPELEVSVKSVSTTNFVLALDYTDDKEGGMVDYVIKDKATNEQIANGQISADKKALYIVPFFYLFFITYSSIKEAALSIITGEPVKKAVLW